MKQRMRVLFISQEVTPYLPDSEISVISRNLPQGIQDSGTEIRTFMPRYGIISERRNQLHEVIRLSGMNMIINETDHPLIIKVASIPSARIQVYFIDNEDYFGHRDLLLNDDGTLMHDSDEQAVFFARGVLETMRKLRWVPNIIHCHGWFTGLVPLYVKKGFREDPIFTKSKVVYSLYHTPFPGQFSENFRNNAIIDGVNKKDVTLLNDADYVAINKIAIHYADAVIKVGETIPDIQAYLDKSKKEVLLHDNDTYLKDYAAFYKDLLK